MGVMDCCRLGIKNELVLETDKDNIQDNEGFPQDTDPAFRSKKVEIENQNENINENIIEESVNPENNNNAIEVEEVRMDNYQDQNEEQAENYENNEANNVDMNVPQTDSNAIQEGNVEINEYNQNINVNEIVNNVQENKAQENDVQNEINIDEILKNYNEQQIQNVENEEDYNKYFEQLPTPVNDNNEIDINQYFTNNPDNQVNLNQLGGLNSHFTFGDSQNNGNNLILNNNEPNSQEYNYEYIIESQKA
jgi:hypothetical protein